MKFEDQQSRTYFSVEENRDKHRIEVVLSGAVPSPEAVAPQISSIREMSEEYQTILLYMNTPGGVADTMVEMINAVKMYDNIITVNTGQCASAGFILWCLGDVRVVSDYSRFLAHRESYSYTGQSDNHLQSAEFSTKHFMRLFAETCSSVVTEAEAEEVKFRDVLFSDTDMVDRGVAITLDDFKNMDNTITTPAGTVFSRGGSDDLFFLDSSGVVSKIESLDLSTSWPTQFDFIYS